MGVLNYDGSPVTDDTTASTGPDYIAPAAPVSSFPSVKTERGELSYNPPPQPEKDWSQVPWSEVASSGWNNAYESAKKQIMAIPEAIYNYPQTGEALSQIGTGINSLAREAGSKDPRNIALRAAMGVPPAVPDSPEKKEADRAALYAAGKSVAEPFTNIYQATQGNTGPLKKSLGTDPFSTIAPVAGLVSMGTGAAGEVAEGLSNAALEARTLKKLSTATSALDPAQAIFGTTGWAASKVGGPLAKSVVSTAANIPPESLDFAYAAGKMTGKDADAVQNAYRSWATGQGNLNDFSGRVRNAFQSLKNDAYNQFASKKQNLMALSQDADLDPIYGSIADARAKLSAQGEGLEASDQAHDALTNVQNNINERFLNTDPNYQGRKIQSLDNLKQDLWEQIQSYPPGSRARNALSQVYDGIKKSIRSVSPEYDNLMSDYQSLQDNLNTIAKSLGTNDKVSATTELNKFVNNIKTDKGRQLIGQLSQKDPTIPFAVAGAIHNAGHTGGILGGVEAAASSGLTTGALYHLMNGNYATAAALTAAIPPSIVMQSPRTLGKISYGAGKFAGSAPGQAAGLAKDAASKSVGASPYVQSFEQANPAITEMKINKPQAVALAVLQGAKSGN